MTTASGIPVQPVYTEAPVLPRIARRKGWQIAARAAAPGVEVVVAGQDLFSADEGADAVTQLRLLSTAPADAVLSTRIGPDFFEEIAKLRALRVLVGDRTIHAVTARPDPGEAEPENHIVRATWHTLAAILGGADWVETTPWNNTPAAAALALQTQQVLRHECGAARHADALAGSCFVDTLTAALLHRAREAPEISRAALPGPFLTGAAGSTPD